MRECILCVNVRNRTVDIKGKDSDYKEERGEREVVKAACNERGFTVISLDLSAERHEFEDGCIQRAWRQARSYFNCTDSVRSARVSGTRFGLTLDASTTRKLPHV
jgi:hypothetical protein